MPEEKTLQIQDATLKHKFTVFPKCVQYDSNLSPGERLLYSLLLSYAWDDDECFPGQQRLAGNFGCKERNIRILLFALRRHGLINWKRRGLNLTNIYYILPLEHRYPVKEDNVALQKLKVEGKILPLLIGQKCPTTKTQYYKTQLIYLYWEMPKKRKNLQTARLPYSRNLTMC